MRLTAGMASLERVRRSFREHARLDEFGRAAGPDLIGRDILENGGAGTHNGTVADGYAGGDESVGGDPHFVADGYGSLDEGKSAGGVVMGAGAEVGVLADDGVTADGDLAQAIEDGVVADDGAFADSEVPGDFNVGGGTDADIGADGGTETAEDQASPGVPIVERTAKEQD